MTNRVKRLVFPFQKTIELENQSERLYINIYPRSQARIINTVGLRTPAAPGGRARAHVNQNQQGSGCALEGRRGQGESPGIGLGRRLGEVVGPWRRC